MKIAISSCGDSLAAHTHGLFGRCDYFVIVDTETGEASAIKNDSAEAATGAGTACAQALFNHGVTGRDKRQGGPECL